MNDGRKKRVKKSVVSTLTLHIVTLVCGLIVPRAILGAYGSEAYGATTSIAQFLSYVTLLEGGIGGVARAALYKPLAEKNAQRISIIVSELKRFFRIIAYIAIGYAIVLACSFKALSHIEVYDWMTSFWLVLVIAVSIFGQYFIGISYSALIQADQRMYVLNFLSIGTTILNAVMVIILIRVGSDLLFVKLVSSFVFLIKPTAMWIYVRRRFGIVKCLERDKDALKQRWTGLGQHLAYFIHSNTDVVVLTVLDNLKSVSVYAVYSMVTQNIQNVVSSLCSGMEALFGDMIAKEEYEKLNKTFDAYEQMISIASVALFSTVYVMIVPFIKLYTSGIEDVNYIQPLFAILITTASIVFCLRFPYSSVVTAAGHFKQTRFGAYGEAALNVCISILLVWRLGLVGVAIGTIVAVSFRFVYIVVYLSKNIVYRPIIMFIKRTFVNVFCVMSIILISNIVVSHVEIDGYLQWALYAAGVTAFSCLFTFCINLILYKRTMMDLLHIILKKRHKNETVH